MELVKPDGSKIHFSYNGERTSHFVYHPAKSGGPLTAWKSSRDEFVKMFKTWLDVCELYEDEQKLSEPVVSNEVKKDILKILDEIETDEVQRCYLIEALAEALWDKPSHDESDDAHTGRKCETHFLPTMKELERRAAELKAMDIGLTAPGTFAPITQSTKHSWAG